MMYILQCLFIFLLCLFGTFCITPCRTFSLSHTVLSFPESCFLRAEYDCIPVHVTFMTSTEFFAKTDGG